MEYGNSFGMFSNHQSKSGQSGRMMGKKPFNALSFAMGETEETDMDDMFKASSSSAEANSSLSSNCSFQIPGGSNKEVLSSTPASTPKSSPYFNGTNVQPSPKTTSSTPPTTGLLRNRVAETNGKAEVGLRPSKAVTFALSAECQASQAHLNVSEAEDEPPMDHQEVHQEPPDEEAEEDDPPIKEPGMKKMKLMEPINVAKLELEFKDLVERVIQERDEDKQRLELYLESFKFKVEEMVQSLEAKIKARSDFHDQQLQSAMDEFYSAAERAQESEDEVNQLKTRMADIIKKHLEGIA